MQAQTVYQAFLLKGLDMRLGLDLSSISSLWYSKLSSYHCQHKPKLPPALIYTSAQAVIFHTRHTDELYLLTCM